MDEKVIQQQGKKRGIKGIADVVFCIDASGSMTDVIEGLKDNIETFIDGLKKNQQISSLDFRVGILAHDRKEFKKLDFTDNLNDFKNALQKIKTRYDEFTLPGLDWALDFNWRKATRIVVVFTDEPLSGGHDVSLQKSKIDELIKKIGILRVNLFFVGIDCPEYNKIINMTPRATGTLIDRSNKTIFSSYDFSNLLGDMGKTLSSNLNIQDTGSFVEKDLYKINGSINVINL